MEVDFYRVFNTCIRNSYYEEVIIIMKKRPIHILVMFLICATLLIFNAGCSACESCGHAVGCGMCAAGEGCLSCGNCWAENSCALSFCGGCNKKVLMGE